MIRVPHTFDLLERGRTLMALRADLRDCLLAHGIQDPEAMLAKSPAEPAPTGRGAVPALMLEGIPGLVMVRRCLRGGLIRFVNHDLYLDRGRPFRELAITEAAVAAGIPAVEVIAAISVRAAGLLYRCYLFSRQLPGCLDLASFLRSRAAAPDFEALKRTALGHAAALVRRMHDAGLYHADLNLKNILVCEADPGRQHIIDWDKSQQHPQGLGPGMRRANAVRLCRSMLKLARTGLPADEADAAVFLRGYADDEEFIDTCLGQLRRAVALRGRLWNLLGG